MARLALPEEANRPHLQDVLARSFSADEIGGPSELGWHALKKPMQCWRYALHTAFCGLRPKRASDALDIGSLLHACLARHYLTGGAETWKPVEAAAAEVPEVAAEAARLLQGYFARFGAEEAETWDVRAVEHEASAKLAAAFPGKNGKPKLLRPRISCRFDTVVALRARGQAAATPGSVPQGCYINDFKTASSLRRDYIAGFGMDGQLLTQALVWKRAGLDKVFGSLQGHIVTVIVKTKTPQYERLRLKITDADLFRFERMIAPYAVELRKRLEDPGDHQNLHQWPMNHAACKSEYGLCKSFDLCESHGSMASLYEPKPGATPLIPVEWLVRELQKEGGVEATPLQASAAPAAE